MPKDKYVDATLDDRYHLQRLLDSGSFGAVYEARDTKLGRIVAVKILFEKDETAFRKEAKLAVQFDHPNVVKVFDYGADSNLGAGYIVMEFLKGCRLDQLITQHRGRVPDSVILRFADQIGAALQLAHDRNLIHRDLKPQNVMLVEEGTLQERFVLLDLGLASQMNSTSTLRNQTLDGALSPRYASPEQMGQQTVDFRSDIYSFGTMLYELFTGEVPFVRDQMLSLMMAICNDTPPPFQFTAPNRQVPSEVEVIVQHCLSKKAAERPESIRVVRSRILAAFGADTAMPPAVAPGIKRSGGLSSSGIPLQTGTMQPPSLDGNSDLPKANSVSRSDWQSSVGRDRRSEKRSRSWLAVLASIVVLLPILFIAVPKVRESPPPTPTSVEHGVQHSPGMRSADEIQISAGGSGVLTVYVEPSDDAVADGQELMLTTSETPDWLQVQIPQGLLPSKMLNLTIISEPVLTARSGEFTLHTSIGTWSDSKKIRVNVVAPEPWTLPAGFEPATGTDLVRAGPEGHVFHRNIVRVIDAELTVTFILIYPPENSSATSKTIPPFYMMENKVWNALFARYWSENGSRDPHSSASADWKDGATAGEQKLGADLHPNLPVVRVTAYDANQFAVWLGGVNVCHLPSIDQWDMASGLLHWLGMTLDQRAAYPVGPFRGPWIEGTTNVCVNRPRLGPQSVRESSDDVTITGCRDMAGNVLELTEHLNNGARVADVIPGSEAGSILVSLRGSSYSNSSPLTWEDLRNPKEFPDATGYDLPDPTIGFRVVLETTK